MKKNKQVLLIFLFLTGITLTAFWQVHQCDFISYDDPIYVTENIHIIHGITIEAIRWAFTSIYANFWHPLTLTSLMLDNEFFGLNPRSYHLTNLMLHIANTLLLFFVFHRMTKAPWKSAFVAALFALHPLHVESVAWISERKDVLSTFFWMLTMCAYIHYVEHPRFGSYLAALAFFIMGLMAKPMLVTLPFAMLLLDYWPLQRFGQKRVAIGAGVDGSICANKKKKAKPGKKPLLQNIGNDARPAEHKHGWAGTSRLLTEKIPFFALVPLFGVLTYIAEGSAVNYSPWNVRVRNALVSYVIYIGKTIWPTDLAVFYPHPGLLPFWQAAGAALLLAAATAAVILTAKRYPYLTIGWLWFAGTLAPVIGIVKLGNFGRADRFTYIPLIGLFIMVAWGVPELLKNWRYRKEALVASSALILCSLSIATWTQVGYWNNSISLYDHSIEVTGNNDTILNNRGVAYGQLGNLRHAISDYEVAIEINPKNVEIYNNLGLAHGKLGDHGQAIEDFDRAVGIDPGHVEAHFNRGIAYDKLGKHRQAIDDFDRVIEIDPEYAEAYFNRGVAYGKLGNQRRAIEDFHRVIGINPEDGRAYFNRAVAFGELGNRGQAIEDLKTAARLGSEEAKNFLLGEGINW
ncbi:MAG: tetratricopeptide repeat protein [Syntrophobacteraceae bacterium]